MSAAIPLALFSLSLALAAEAGDWPQWRGASRTGHADLALDSLPRQLKVAWKKPVGPGFSGPIVTGGRVILLDAKDGKEVAHGLDAKTGAENWSVPFAAGEGDEWGSGPRSTPFADGDRVYVQSMNGEFRCLTLADGKILWGFSFTNYGIHFSTKSAEGTAARRGNNGSGIVDGGRVYVPVGARGASVVCLDKLTGREIWRSGDDEAAYSSFVVGTLAGTKQLVAFTAEALTSLDLETGAVLWRMPLKTGAKRHAATPVLDGDTVTVCSQTIGMVRVKVSKEGERLVASQAWVNKPLTVNLSTPVLLNGHLYGYGPIRTKDYVCVDASTGALKWRQDGFGIGKDQTDYASSIVVGKNVLALTYDGQLVLVAGTPEKYAELGRVQVCGKTWSHPALADGKLYVRDGRELQCLELTTAAAPH